MTRWAQIRTDEGGFAMVVALLLLVIVMALGTAGLAESLDSRALSDRAANVRRAQQAADAGVQAQVYQQSENQIGNAGSSYDLNGGLLNQASLLDCVEPVINASLQVTGLLPVAINASSGVCPPSASGAFSVMSLGQHAYAESEYIPSPSNPLSGASETDLAPKVVSLGWEGSSNPTAAGNVFAREEAILAPISPLPVLGANHNLTVSGVSALGISLTSAINGDLQAVSGISLPLVTVGANTNLSNGLLAVFKCGCGTRPSGLPVANWVGNATVPYRQPVTVSSTKAPCPAPDANGASNCSDVNGYVSATDTVNAGAGGVTLYGGDYVFCGFSSTGPVNAYPAANKPVRIFIDNPKSARCANNSPLPAQNATNSVFSGLTFWNYGNFKATQGVINNGVAGVVKPSGVQIYVVGDGVRGPAAYDDNTYVQLGTPPSGIISTNPTQSEIVYAPTSDVLMTTADCSALILCTGSAFSGNIIGNDVTATASVFTQDLDLGNDPLYNGVNAYHVLQYVQCSPQPVDSGGTTYTTLQKNATTYTNGC